MSEFLIVLVILFVLYIAIHVAIIRWIFRIDIIVDLLKKIESHHSTHSEDKLLPDDCSEPVVEPEEPLQNCDACGKTFKTSELHVLAIGKTVCKGCEKFITKQNAR